MRKHLTTFWRIVKEEASFLWRYRREHRRRNEELADLEFKLKMGLIELAFAIRSDAKARREKKI